MTHLLPEVGLPPTEVPFAHADNPDCLRPAQKNAEYGTQEYW